MSDKVNTIIFVPIGGDLTGITDIERFCNKNNLHLVIDAAHAFGSSLNGKGASDFGDCVCYSFDGIKNITCGEGGCVSSNCDEIIEKIKIRRALGIEKVSPSAAGNSYDFQVNQNGWRYHLSNINAAIGNEQLKRLDYFKKVRRNLAKHYNALLGSTQNIEIFQKDYDEICPHIYFCLLPNNVDRNVLRDRMLTKGIETGVHYKPVHHLNYFVSNSKFPVADGLASRLLTLPLHVDLKEKEVQFICSTLIEEIYNLS